MATLNQVSSQWRKVMTVGSWTWPIDTLNQPRRAFMYSTKKMIFCLCIYWKRIMLVCEMILMNLNWLTQKVALRLIDHRFITLIDVTNDYLKLNLSFSYPCIWKKVNSLVFMNFWCVNWWILNSNATRSFVLLKVLVILQILNGKQWTASPTQILYLQTVLMFL